MADEQGTGRPDGNFARIAIGKAVNAILDNVGASGRKFEPLESPPDNPETGDTYLADGANWDVAGTGNAALATYIDGAWEVTNEYSTGL
jgi:hypothetical protein